MGKTATKIRDLNKHKALYRLSESIDVNWDDDSPQTFFVVASKSHSWTGQSNPSATWDGPHTAEVLVFPANEDGSTINLVEVWGSYNCPGGHVEALEGMGFTVVDSSTPEGPWYTARFMRLEG